jgi:probable rRNA maturation factor
VARLEINLVFRVPCGLSRRLLTEIIRAALPRSKKKVALTVAFVGDAEIRRLNRRYRGRDEVTDVLSFPLAGGFWPKQEQELGDIIISVSEARRETKRFGRKYRDEIALLVVHGVLHLLGFDHVKKSERKRMFGRQNRIMKKLGAGKEALFQTN